MKDFLVNILESLRDRIKSPLVGAYIISFFFWNFTSLYLFVYSDYSVENRVQKLENNIHFSNVLTPLGIALLYILVLPYINLGFDALLRLYSNEKIKRKNKLSLQRLDHKEQEAEREYRISSARAGTNAIIDLQRKIEGLQVERQELSDTAANLQNRLNVEISDKNKLMNENQQRIKEIKDLITSGNSAQAELNKKIEEATQFKLMFENRAQELEQVRREVNILRGTSKFNETYDNLFTEFSRLDFSLGHQEKLIFRELFMLRSKNSIPELSDSFFSLFKRLKLIDEKMNLTLLGILYGSYLNDLEHFDIDSGMDI